MDKYITIKGKKDGIEIKLDKDIPFDELVERFTKKIILARGLFGKGNVTLSFLNRTLSEDEENKLIDIIKENSDLEITVVYSKNPAEREKDMIGKNLQKSLALEGMTQFYRGNLRSGRKLQYEGNIVILGDVNPGAEVYAKGNILVLGHLNGSVFAGQSDKNDSFVGAIFMNPVHLTIGDIPAKPLQDRILDTNKVNKKNKFKIAFLKDDEIVIEDFDVRSFI